MKLFTLTSILLFGVSSFAGGMISAGPVTLSPLISCLAKSIDVTHPSQINRAVIASEVGTENFQVLVLMKNNEVIRYYPIMIHRKGSADSIVYKIARYGYSSSTQIGSVYVSKIFSGSGNSRILPSQYAAVGELAELSLFNCSLVANTNSDQPRSFGP